MSSPRFRCILQSSAYASSNLLVANFLTQFLSNESLIYTIEKNGTEPSRGTALLNLKSLPRNMKKCSHMKASLNPQDVAQVNPYHTYSISIKLHFNTNNYTYLSLRHVSFTLNT